MHRTIPALITLRRATLTLAACAFAGFGALALAASPRPAPSPLDAGTAKSVDFAKDIQPLIKESCVRCHKAPDAKEQGRGPGGPGGGRPRGPAGGLRLDDPAAAMKGGKHGKAIVPGKPDESLFYTLLKGPVTSGGDDIDPMPKPKRGEEFKPLPADKIELVKQWIEQGAKWSK